MKKESGTFLYHTACLNPECGSSDGLAIYEQEDGHVDGTCFVCHKYFPNPLGGDVDNKVAQPTKSIDPTPVNVDWVEKLPINELKDRSISKEACEFYGIRVAYNETNGEISKHYYPTTKENKITGYKERVVWTKGFSSLGDTKRPQFFGQWKYPEPRKLLIIVEGELDAASARDMLKMKGKEYAVVSVPHGAESSKRTAQDNYEWLEKWETVILALDADKPGERASKEIAEILTPGKAKICKLPMKDANEMLMANQATAFLKAIWNAREYRPDGIVRLSDAWEEMWKDEDIESIPYPYSGLNDKLYGIRPREIVTYTSGSGMGKSAVIRELTHWLFRKTDSNIGVLALEESIGRTQWGIVSIEANKPLHIREERSNVPREQIREAWERTVGTGRFCSYDHFGSTSSDNLINQVRYLIKGMDCQYIFLDHLSIVVSSMEEAGDERRTIDDIMTRLRTLVEETGAGLALVTHLRRAANDKGHERGAEVTLNQLRGSHSIAQLSDAVIGMERNQQHDDPKLQNLTKLVVLKNRYAGYTGAACHLYYDKRTGRLYEIHDIQEFIEEDDYQLVLPQ